MNTEDNNLTNKGNIVLLGDNAVGKTALVQSLSGRDFNPNEMLTRGFEEVEFEKNSGIEIVDFGGQKIYGERIAKRINGLEIGLAFIVISSRQDNVQSSVSHWYSQLRNNIKENNSLEIHLVVTQCDQGSPVIDELGLYEEFGFKDIHKTSAKTGVGIQGLREAAYKIFSNPEEEEKGVNFIISVMVKKLCELIAKTPAYLQDIEWRDLERIIAASLEELGFDVQLTPPSKDGGKDVVANCTVNNEGKVYFVEIKHWRKGGKPGDKHVSEFVEVNLENNTDGGLFISSSGFTNSVHSRLGELMRQEIRLGTQNKIVALCQQYIRSKSGIWQNKSQLPELLFEDTL